MNNKKIIIYGTIEVWEFESWIDGFNKIHPNVEVEYFRKYVFGTPPPMSQKIKQDLNEKGSSADIVLSAISPHLQMLNQDLFYPYNSRERRNISDSLKDSEGFWTSVVLLPVIQIYNTDLVDKNELPKSHIDLLTPRWKNKLSIHDVTLGTFGSNWLSSLRNELSNAQWTNFVNSLSNQQLQLWPLFRQVLGNVSLGNSDIGLTVMLYEYLRALDKDLPIKRFVISDIPTLISATAASILKTSKNIESAKLFIDFIISKEGQNLIGNNYLRIPASLNSNSKFSLSKLLPNEQYSIFPSKEVLDTTNHDRILFQKLFTQQTIPNNAFDTDVDDVLK